MGDTVLLQTSAHAQVAGLVDSVKEVLYYRHAITYFQCSDISCVYAVGNAAQCQFEESSGL